MLELDSPRWRDLTHAYGPADDVPAMLRALAGCAGSRDDAWIWETIWSALCHQGTVYTATYAALPHIVELATSVPVSRQLPYWSFVGAVAASTDAAWLPDDLRPDWSESLDRAAAAVVRALDARPATELDALYLLQAAAATRGWTACARILDGLLDGELRPRCGGCGSELYVSMDPGALSVTDEQPGAYEVTRRTMVEPLAADPRREGCLHQLASLAVRAGFDAIAARLRTLGGTVTCPSCERRFLLAEELVAWESAKGAGG